MFDKFAMDSLNFELDLAAVGSTEQSELNLARASGMVAYALIVGDISHAEYSRMNQRIQTVRATLVAHQIRDMRLRA